MNTASQASRQQRWMFLTVVTLLLFNAVMLSLIFYNVTLLKRNNTIQGSGRSSLPIDSLRSQRASIPPTTTSEEVTKAENNEQTKSDPPASQSPVHPLDSIEPIAVLGEHSNAVMSVEFSPDGLVLASADYDRKINLWSVAERKRTASLRGHQGPIQCMAFSTDGALLASASGTSRGEPHGEIILWDVAEESIAEVLPGHSTLVNELVFVPGKDVLASASYDGTVKLWDTKSGKGIASLEADQQLVYTVAISHDGGTLVAGGHNAMTAWQLDNGSPTHAIWRATGSFRSLVFSPSNELVGIHGYSVGHWHLRTGGLLETVARIERADVVRFSPAGKHIAISGHVPTVTVVHFPSGKRVQMWNAHEPYVASLAYSPDGGILASGGREGDIKLWDVTKLPDVSEGEPDPLD